MTAVETVSPSTRYDPAKRAVITGLGVITPAGIGVEEHWGATIDGEQMVRPIESFDPKVAALALAGQVSGFEPADHADQRLLVQTDRWTWFAFAAAQMALDDAGYDPSQHDPYATSVILGSGSGGNEFGQREIQALWSRGPRRVGAYQSIAWFYAASTGQLSILHGTKGPSGVLVADAAGGLDSLGWARRSVRRGTAAVVAGGTEAPLSPYALACHASSGRISTETAPSAAYKPFDRDANGYVPGEGGAVLIVEHADLAAQRGDVDIYGEIAGYAATHDADFHRRTPPDARWLTTAIEGALADASIEAGDVDLVIADGSGSPDLDGIEAEALCRVFGPEGVPVTAPQGSIGRLCAGGSALAAANALLAIRHGMAPAVGNLDEPDPRYRLDLVRAPTPFSIRTVLVVARGHGGFNTALVLTSNER